MFCFINLKYIDKKRIDYENTLYNEQRGTSIDTGGYNNAIKFYERAHVDWRADYRCYEEYSFLAYREIGIYRYFIEIYFFILLGDWFPFFRAHIDILLVSTNFSSFRTSFFFSLLFYVFNLNLNW